MKDSKLLNMMLISLFAAIIGLLAQIAIPLPFGVPITGQTLAIGLTATILGGRNGTLATLLYLAIGAVGIPVFAQLTSGFGMLIGPTGGFLIGFIPTAYFIGWYLEKTAYHFLHALIANIVGMIITLTFGSLWLKFLADLSWTAAFLTGFLPFIIVGIIKAIIAAWLGIALRKRLSDAHLL